ncbi:MAG: TonB-dependent receptor [Calditrichaeota bacterium]|nr:TonB-dependent receptor [Candidatus Cloacimonadota bacterium]MCB1046333.1 TonB-dependent receptor [Calditrichota bacterium]
MFSRLLFALCLLFVPGIQAVTLTGHVRDAETHRPLEAVNLTVVGSTQGAATDQNGAFIITGLQAGPLTLSASHLGYLPLEVPTVIGEQAPPPLTVLLVPTRARMDDVVFTATRSAQHLKDVPVATELLRASEMHARSAFTAAEALDAQVGITVSESIGGEKQVSLQGIDPDKVLVLVDGRRVVGRIRGALDLEQLATLNVRQIEVVKGSLSTLYGNEAIGGVVNIITDHPTDAFGLTVDMGGGSYYSRRGDGSPVLDGINHTSGITIGKASETRSMDLGIQFRHMDPLDSDPTTTETDGVFETDRLNLNARLKQQVSTGEISLDVRSMDENKNWIEDSRRDERIPFRDEETNTRRDGVLTWHSHTEWADEYTWTLYHTANRHRWEKYTTRGERLRSDFNNADEDYSELAVNFVKSYGDHYGFNAGVEGYRGVIRGQSGGTSEPFDRTTSAGTLYWQNEIRSLRNWTLMPGVRFEYHDIYRDNWSPRMAVMYAPGDWRVRASVGKGYKAPTAKQLAFVFDHQAVGYRIEGNPDLDPEYSLNLNAGIEWLPAPEYSLRLNGFRHNLDDLIDFDLEEQTTDYYVGIYRYRNIKSAWIEGIELEQNLQHGPWMLDLAWSWLRTRDRSSGRELLNRPRHTANWIVGYSRGALQTRLWGRYTGSSLFAPPTETEQTVGEALHTVDYAIWNTSVSWAFTNHLRCWSKVENLLDRTDPLFGPFQGRTFWLGLHWQTRLTGFEADDPAGPTAE